MTVSIRIISAVAAALLTLGCSSSGGARPAAGDNVIDITWKEQGDYAMGERRTRDRYDELRQNVSRFNREYYESRVRTVDSSGQPLAPIDQVEFRTATRSNVREGSIELATVTKAADPEEPAFIDQNGNRVLFSDFRGKPLVLVFTRGFPGYICPMCTAYTAQFVVNYPKIKAAGAEVAIVFPGSEREVEDFLEASREIAASGDDPGFPILLDPSLLAVSRFGIAADLARPSTYIFDSEGKVRWGYVGDQPHDRPSVATVLAELAKIK